MASKPRQALTTPTGQLLTRGERWRQNIKVGKAVKYLNDVVDGVEEPNAVRVNAAKFLINKVVPEPPALKHEDPLAGAKDITHRDPHYLLRIIEGDAERKAG